jgi:hypothetical protein
MRAADLEGAQSSITNVPGTSDESSRKRRTSHAAVGLARAIVANVDVVIM